MPQSQARRSNYDLEDVDLVRLENSSLRQENQLLRKEISTK